MVKIRKIVYKNNLEIYQQRANKSRAANLIFCHGVGSQSEHYTDWWPLLTEYNFYLLNLPGHNNLPVKKSEMTIKAYAEKIVGWIKQSRLKNIILIGHSMGGAIVAEVAAKLGPKYIKSVVLVAPYNIRCANLFAFLYIHGQFNTLLLKNYIAATKHKHSTEFIKLANNFLAFLKDNSANLHTVVKHLTHFQTLRESTLAYKSLDGIPTTLITFAKDILVPAKASEKYLLKLIPHLNTLTIPDATHVYLLEKPNEFITELRKIISKK